MNTPINQRPSASSGLEAIDRGGGQACDAAEGAKNTWNRTGRHWNPNVATFNRRTLYSEASIEVLFEELKGVQGDVIHTEHK